ncbi:MAG: DUF6252 family protein [Ginsengibacter sp.]
MRARVIITASLLLCIFNSCQKELEDPLDTPAGTTPNFNAKVSGVLFSATAYTATINKTDSIIYLLGTTTDGRQISFTVKDSGEHVYSLDFNSITNFGRYIDVNTDIFGTNGGASAVESGGNLAIVSIDPVKKLMSGTFNFRAFQDPAGPQKIITEGVFHNIGY